MIYTVKPTSRFQRDVKLANRRGYRMSLLTDTIKLLASGQPLPPITRTTP